MAKKVVVVARWCILAVSVCKYVNSLLVGPAPSPPPSPPGGARDLPSSQIQTKRTIQASAHTNPTLHNYPGKPTADDFLNWPFSRLLCVVPNNRQPRPCRAGDPQPQLCARYLVKGAHLKLRHIDFAHVGDPNRIHPEMLDDRRKELAREECKRGKKRSRGGTGERDTPN